MVTQSKDLWSLVLERQQIDPQDLTAAIEEQIIKEDLDYRSRVLIRDSVKALRHYWGPQRLAAWLEASPVGKRIESICNQEWDDDRGFPSLMRRVMDVTQPETIRQFFRDLARHVRRPLLLHVGGSAALILPGYLSRRTDDIDVVDEVPAAIRSEHELLKHLKEVHHLELSHFQRHYLPMGWEQRLHSLPPFDRLQVYLVDPGDVFLSKLFSIRTKDRQDLKELAPKLDKEALARRLKETCQSTLAAPDLRQRAEDNWYMLYGEALLS